MSGPYDVSGLSDGFAQGFGLALKKNQQDYDQDYRQKQLDLDNRTQARADKLGDSTINVNNATIGNLGATTAHTQAETARTQQQTGFDAQNQDYTMNVLHPQQTRAADDTHAATVAGLGLTAAQTATQRAQSGYLGAETRGANIRAEQGQYELDNQKKIQALTTARERIASMPFANPAYLETAQKLDALTQGIPTDVTPQDTLAFFNDSLKPELNTSIGQTVDKAKAAQYGFSRGSVISGMKITDAHYDPARHGFAIQLDVTAKDPATGKEVTYPSFVTDKRSSSPDDPIKFVSADKLHGLVQNVGMISDQIHANNLNPQATQQGIIDQLDAQINGITQADPQKYIKVNRSGAYNTATGQWDAPPAKLGNPGTDQYQVGMQKIISDPRLSDADRAQRLTELGKGFGKPPVTKEQAATLPKPQGLVRNNSGQWGLRMSDGSVTPITDEQAKQYQ